MRIEPLPETDTLVLRAHEGKSDAPVFVYRPLTVDDWVQLSAEMARDESGTMGTYFVRLFRDRVVRVENLTIGEELYRHPDDARHLPPPWLIEVGRRIWERATLTEDEAGKSSSP